jgi:hypothetical protein
MESLEVEGLAEQRDPRQRACLGEAAQGSPQTWRGLALPSGPIYRERPASSLALNPSRSTTERPQRNLGMHSCQSSCTHRIRSPPLGTRARHEGRRPATQR